MERTRAPAAPRLRDERTKSDAAALVDATEWEGAHITGDIVGADLTGAEITGCVLEVRASGADLERSRIVDTRFERCELSGLRLGETHLLRVEMRQCRLSSVDLAQAHARDVRFVDCRIDDANVRMADFERVVFEGCDLGRADFGGSKLVDVDLVDCDLRGVDFTKARTERVRLHCSRVEDVKGALALKGATIDPNQVVALGLRVLLEMGVRITTRAKNDEPA